MVGVVIPIKGDCFLRLVEVSGSGHLDQEDLLAFLLLLARRKACRGSTKDHEGVVHLGEPIVLVIVPVAGPFRLGVVVGGPELGVVTPEHGAILEGVLYQALMVRARFPKHVVEGSRALEASGILAFCGRDQRWQRGIPRRVQPPHPRPHGVKISPSPLRLMGNIFSPSPYPHGDYIPDGDPHPQIKEQLKSTIQKCTKY